VKNLREINQFPEILIEWNSALLSGLDAALRAHGGTEIKLEIPQRRHRIASSGATLSERIFLAMASNRLEDFVAGVTTLCRAEVNLEDDKPFSFWTGADRQSSGRTGNSRQTNRNL
jgi:hypothetical protein